MIRRTACYNIAPKKAEFRSKILYGPLDEGVLRQVGRMDSTETLDILELEPNSTAIHEVL